MQYVFHIGLHKTGSSAVQEYFRAFMDFNIDHGLLYPRTLSNTPSHGEFPWALLGEQARWRTDDFDLAEVWAHHKTLAEKMEQGRGVRTTLFSSEDFSLLSAHPDKLKAFHNMVKGEDVWIAVSLRAPLDYIVSWYRHAIRTGQTTAGPEELERIAPWKSLEFSSRLAPWAELFGADKMIVNLYESNSIKTYTEAFGLPIAPDYKPRRVNAPPHPWAIDAYRMLPKEQRFDKARRRLLRLSERGPKVDPVKALGVKPEVKNRARRFEEDMEKAIKLYPTRKLPV